MIHIIPYVDTILNEPDIITHKQGKYLLGKFLMENKLLDTFVTRYKYARYKECKTIEGGKRIDAMTYNDVLYDCINRVDLDGMSFREVFNYDFLSFSWWEPATNIDWFVIHNKWQNQIGCIYFRKHDTDEYV